MSTPYIRDFTIIGNGLRGSFFVTTVFLVSLRLLQEDRNARICYGCIQVVLSLAVDFFAGSIASSAHRSRSVVELFDRFPYCAVMYYGAVDEATFGSVLIIMTLVHSVCGGMIIFEE